MIQNQKVIMKIINREIVEVKMIIGFMEKIQMLIEIGVMINLKKHFELRALMVRVKNKKILEILHNMDIIRIEEIIKNIVDLCNIF